MPQQPMPVQAPVAQSAAAGKGLLVVAGLAVVGAAAFGGVYLMNATSAQPAAATSAPATVVNLPSTIEIPSLTPSQEGPASVPMIVNNPAPVRVFSPTGPATAPAPAPAPCACSGSTGHHRRRRPTTPRRTSRRRKSRRRRSRRRSPRRTTPPSRTRRPCRRFPTFSSRTSISTPSDSQARNTESAQATRPGLIQASRSLMACAANS